MKKNKIKSLLIGLLTLSISQVAFAQATAQIVFACRGIYAEKTISFKSGNYADEEDGYTLVDFSGKEGMEITTSPSDLSQGIISFCKFNPETKVQENCGIIEATYIINRQYDSLSGSVVVNRDRVDFVGNIQGLVEPVCPIN